MTDNRVVSRNKYRNSPKGRAMIRRSNLKYWHSLTVEEYNSMLEQQGGVCAICKEEQPLHVDHDRSCCPTKKSCRRCIRGLLCTNCNNGLGRFKDDPARLLNAARYITELNSER